MSKLTPWFPPEIKPVRKGVYMASVGYTDDIYRYWNGRWWGCFGDTPKIAEGQRETRSASSNDMQWRGLARKPK